MDDSVIVGEFEKLAGQLGIEIRYTAGGPSGLCTVKSSRVLFIDRNLDKKSRIDLFVREFKNLELESVFIVPLIRRLLGLEEDY